MSSPSTAWELVLSCQNIVQLVAGSEPSLVPETPAIPRVGILTSVRQLAAAKLCPMLSPALPARLPVQLVILKLLSKQVVTWGGEDGGQRQAGQQQLGAVGTEATVALCAWDTCASTPAARRG